MPKILLTGAPGGGKTTLLQKAVAQLTQAAGGFYTQELRVSGVRTGFEILTLDGQRGVLARVGFHSPHRVGKYGVDLATLDTIGVNAIYRALQTGKLVVIDEIGPMELLSARFRTVVTEVLNSPANLLATIVRRSTPFSDAVKRRSDVTLIEVRPENRDRLVTQIVDLFVHG